MAEATPAPKPTSKKQRQRGPQLALDPPAGARRPHFPSISRQIPLAFPAWHCPWHPFPHIHRPPPVNLPSSARSLSPRRPSGGASSPAFVFRRRPCGPVFPRPQPRRASHLAPRLLLPSAVQPHPPPPSPPHSRRRNYRRAISILCSAARSLWSPTPKSQIKIYGSPRQKRPREEVGFSQPGRPCSPRPHHK